MQGDTQDAVELALARSLVYRFLSLALRPPDQGLATAACDDAWDAALGAARQAGEPVAAAAAAAYEAVAGLAPDALAAEYHRVFGHTIGIRCPPYESQYAGEVFQQAHCLANIAGFYRAFGLQVGDDTYERPDHLSVELEFMHALAYREAYARRHHGPGEVEVLIDAQRLFLREHLGHWIPSFAQVLSREAGEPYRSLALWLSAWVAADAEALGARPEDADLTPFDGMPAGDLAAACGACPVEVSS